MMHSHHVAAPVTEVAQNIFQVQVPVPFPLRAVNCYLVRGGDAWTMIDTGLQYTPARETWAHAFHTLRIAPRAIQKILLTHAHPDHYGLAGYFQDLTGAPVYLLDMEIQIVPLEWNPRGEHMDMIANFFKMHGLPLNVGDTVHERQMQVLAMVQPQPVLSPLHEGEELEIGEEIYRVVWTPGHADGHVIFHRADGAANGAAFVGDHVLMKITPNIALWPRLDANPLKHYLESLTKVEQLDITRGLPGHRAIIHDMRGRIAELRAHHAARLKECFAAARNCTAYEVCLEIFPRLKTVDETRMALVETLSHLEYLVAEGKLSRHTTRKAEGEELIQYMTRGE